MDEVRDSHRQVEKVQEFTDEEAERLSGKGDIAKRALFDQVAMHSARRRQFRLSKMRD